MSFIAPIVVSAVVLIGIAAFKIISTKSNPNRRKVITVYIILAVVLFVGSSYSILSSLGQGGLPYRAETLHTIYGENSCALFVKERGNNYSLVFYAKDTNGDYQLQDTPKLVQRGPCKIGTYTIYQVEGTNDFYVYISTRLTNENSDIKDNNGNKLHGAVFEWDIDDEAKYMHIVAGYVGNSLDGFSVCIDDEIIEVG